MFGDNQINRFFLKRDAKANLRGKYGAAVVVALLAHLLSRISYNLTSFFTGIFTSTAPLRVRRFHLETDPSDIDELFTYLAEVFDKIIAYPMTLIALVLLVALLSLSYAVFVGNVIRIGARRWFLRSSHPHYATPSIGLLFSCFRGGQYAVTWTATLWKSFWLFLWSIPVFLTNILLITPIVLLLFAYVKTGADAITPALIDRVLDAYGLPEFFYSPAFFIVTGLLMTTFSVVLIIKRYQYRMADYILADNPFIGARRALSLSKRMSNGSLWRLFVLDLSFVGWFLLASMCICLPGAAVYLVLPYYEATWAEAYKNRRDDMVARRELTMEELGYIPM